MYSYSTDEERYSGSFESREEALEEAKACVTERDGKIWQNKVWTGENRHPTLSTYLTLDGLLERAGETAYDEAGDPVENWNPTATKDLEREFCALVDAFADKHGLQPNFFVVDRIEEHDFNEGEGLTPPDKMNVCFDRPRT